MRDYITTLVFINHEVNPERLHHSPNFGFVKNKLVQMNPYYFITNSHCQSCLQIYVRGTLPFSKVQRQWDCKGFHFITCLWLRLPLTDQNPWSSFYQKGHNRAWSQFFSFYKKTKRNARNSLQTCCLARQQSLANALLWNNYFSFKIIHFQNIVGRLSKNYQITGASSVFHFMPSK